MFRLTTLVTLLLIMQSSVTFAEGLESASLRLCEHVKVCVTEQIGTTDNVTPEMKAMIDGMVNNMCKSMMDVSEVQGKAGFEKSAIACIDSITELSCADIENAGQTPACLAFEQKVSNQ